MKNPKAIQEEMRKATAHFQAITDVRQFGRGGISCSSPDQTCVADLLKCESFGNHPAAAGTLGWCSFLVLGCRLLEEESGVLR